MPHGTKGGLYDMGTAQTYFFGPFLVQNGVWTGLYFVSAHLLLIPLVFPPIPAQLRGCSYSLFWTLPVYFFPFSGSRKRPCLYEG